MSSLEDSIDRHVGPDADPRAICEQCDSNGWWVSEDPYHGGEPMQVQCENCAGQGYVDADPEEVPFDIFLDGIACATSHDEITQASRCVARALNDNTITQEEYLDLMGSVEMQKDAVSRGAYDDELPF